MSMASDHRNIAAAFDAYFSAGGYVKIESVNITSKIDRTVYLTNSATNLFKAHLDDRRMIFARQRCMRTQNLLDFYNEESETQYPTYFESYGAYVPFFYVQKLLDDAIGFFVSAGLIKNRMRIRISGKDPLALGIMMRSSLKDYVTLDDRDEKYAHKYGADLTGRAIKLDYYQESQEKYKNLCYFVIIIRESSILGAELATSDQLLLMRLRNLKYGVSVSKVADILPTETFEQRRFADCIAATAHLLYEGIRPKSSNTNGRTLKKFIVGLKYFANRLGISSEEIYLVIREYLGIEYGKDYANCNHISMSAIKSAIDSQAIKELERKEIYTNSERTRVRDQ